MMRSGKHAKLDRSVLAKAAAGLLTVLIVVQILMLSDTLRSHLSIVDRLEGQSIDRQCDWAERG